MGGKPPIRTVAQWAAVLSPMSAEEAAALINHECDYLRGPQRDVHLAGALRALVGDDSDWAMRGRA